MDKFLNQSTSLVCLFFFTFVYLFLVCFYTCIFNDRILKDLVLQNVIVMKKKTIQNLHQNTKGNTEVN